MYLKKFLRNDLQTVILI